MVMMPSNGLFRGKVVDIFGDLTKSSHSEWNDADTWAYRQSDTSLSGTTWVFGWLEYCSNNSFGLQKETKLRQRESLADGNIHWFFERRRCDVQRIYRSAMRRFCSGPLAASLVTQRSSKGALACMDDDSCVAFVDRIRLMRSYLDCYLTPFGRVDRTLFDKVLL